MKKKQKISLAIRSAVGVALLGALAVGNGFAFSFDQILADYFGRIGEGTSGSGVGHYVSDYATKEECLAAFENLNKQVVAEGSVLLKNDKGALPLKKDSNISIFGMSSFLWMTLDRIPGAKSTDFMNSFEDHGLHINAEIRKLYKKSTHTNYGQGDPKGSGDGAGDWKIDEMPQSEYTDAVKKSYASYSDAAIVVLSRGSGEGADLPRSMDRFGGEADKHYLQLTKEEEDLFQAINDAGCFKKIIVVLHSAGAMQMDFVEKYNVDAVLWTAGTGVGGMESVPAIIAGEINPSGKTVDTYCYDNYSSPAMQNFGDFRFANADGSNSGFSYVNCAEGIYVGYRYYETRYEDTVLKRANVGSYNYDKTVFAPFGYGLSYTTFDYSDYKCEYDSSKDSYDVSVKVTNTGSVAGKEVVEIYSQSEYTDYDVQNKVEKSAVNLCGFAKTKELKKGESQTLTVEVPRYNLATYDSFGYGTFILDGGDYYLTAASDAHTAANNILAAKGESVEGDKSLVQKFTYETDASIYSTSNGFKVENQFDQARLADAVYLSRSDWKKMDEKGVNWFGIERGGLTYATAVKSGISNTTNAAKEVATYPLSAEMKERLTATGWSASGNPNAIDSYPAITTQAQNGLVLADLVGVDYEDEKWDLLLDELSVESMHNQYKMGAYSTVAIPEINKPITHEYDGPEGVHIVYGTAQIMIGTTWNDELAEQYGSINGSYAVLTGANGWYAPGVDLHRTPFSGRNYEYFSEDGYFTGRMASRITAGAKEKGLNVVMKHCVLNDQESNRDSNGCVATFATEQAIREINLKAFEIPIKEVGALGVMSAMNRIGTIRARSNYNLNVNVLRNEWNFKGMLITDYNLVNPEESMACVAGGCDTQLYGQGNPVADYSSTGIQYMLRQSAKHILYMTANSIAMNGFSSDTVYHAGVPVYVLLLVGVDVLITAMIVLAILLQIQGYRLENDGVTDEKALKRHKTLTIVYWSVAGTLFVATLVVFFVWALPLLEQAFEIS
ncbi:MAG: glycoside hydrolase family 3 protein [Clostridia bacterium]|nr:glycoside hydrolase family 3 protein [Clostridia bacterium]